MRTSQAQIDADDLEEMDLKWQMAMLTSKPVPLTAVRPVISVVPKTSVTKPKQVKPIVTKPNSPTRRYINRSSSPKASNSPLRVTAVKALIVNVAQESDHPAFNVKLSSTKPDLDLSHTNSPSAPIIEDWVSDSKDESETKTPQNILNFGNPQHALKDKGVIDSGCSRHMTWNMSYLSYFEELNGGYVSFGGNPKGGTISGKGKIRTGKVPRENNMYNVNLMNIVPSGDLTYLFAKATIDESDLWHRRLGHINFKTINKLVKGNLVRGLPTKVFKNDNTCVACKKGKQHRASCKTKPVSSIKQPLYRLHIDLFGPTFVKSLNKKSYCLVVTDDYSRVLRFSNNSINEVNAVGTLVPTVGQIFPNRTDTFSAAGPSNAAASPTHGKSLCIDASQLPDDPDMLELEDITYSDDEDDVGAEAGFNNLETSIIVSPIPTTRVHKD
nr:putative ribonuclease H-like domain-containing protein [Tanacetum cinerariifolium]